MDENRGKIDHAGTQLTVLELALAIRDASNEWADCLDDSFLALANELGRSAGWALNSTEPRCRTDWLNVHGAKVAQLEREFATTLHKRLSLSESVSNHVYASIEQLGWSRDHLERLASRLSSDYREPDHNAISDGRANAITDENELAARNRAGAHGAPRTPFQD